MKNKSMITQIRTGKLGIVAIECKGALTTEDYDTLNGLLGAEQKQHGSLNLYIEVVSFKWNSAEAMFDDLKTGLKFYGSVSKVAIATPKKWLAEISNVADKILPKKIKTYDLNQRSEAINWLK